MIWRKIAIALGLLVGLLVLNPMIGASALTLGNAQGLGAATSDLADVVQYRRGYRGGHRGAYYRGRGRYAGGHYRGYRRYGRGYYGRRYYGGYYRGYRRYGYYGRGYYGGYRRYGYYGNRYYGGYGSPVASTASESCF
jgi:hypothetical protein